jgi:prevent-host-death family protein
MKPSQTIKPISYVKANTAEVLRQVNETREPVVITQNGEAKAVLQDVGSYEELQESLALLKLIAQGKRDLDDGHARPLRRVVADLRKQLKQRDE